MDEYLRFGLLIIAGLILVFILIESWWRRRRFKMAEMTLQNFHPTSVKKAPTFSSESCAINLTPTEPPIQQSIPLAPVQRTAQPQPEIIVEQAEPELPLDDDYIIISVFAKPQMHFGSYDLLQAITSTGMQFGEMNIFHYYLPTDARKKPLFSLASATKPGEFNLDRIGDFSCAGLTLFMDLRNVDQPRSAFETMVKVAEQLADDLDGEMRAGNRILWTEAVLQQYRNKIQ
jgi:cell division protein ZipA